MLEEVRIMDLSSPFSRKGKQLEADVLSAYFESCDSARSQASGDVIGFDGIDSETARQRARLAWSFLYRARVFVVDPVIYAACYRKADMYTCDLAGLEWNGSEANEEEAEKLFFVCNEQAQKISFPEKLPFDSVFLGYGKELHLTSMQASLRVTYNAIYEMGIQEMRLFGHLLGICGDTQMAFAAVHMKGKNVNGVGLVLTYFNQDPDPWAQPFNLDPWVLPMLVDAINNKTHLTIEQPTLGMKLDRKTLLKRHGGTLPLPMPYYRVTLRDTFAEEAIRRFPHPGRSLLWSHRWDVSAHDCVRVVKGKLPLDIKTRARLMKRGYRVFDLQPIPSEDLKKLEKRRIRRDPDEWLAILVYRRDHYIKGPSDKPYIPARRVL